MVRLNSKACSALTLAFYNKEKWSVAPHDLFSQDIPQLLPNTSLDIWRAKACYRGNSNTEHKKALLSALSETTVLYVSDIWWQKLGIYETVTTGCWGCVMRQTVDGCRRKCRLFLTRRHICGWIFQLMSHATEIYIHDIKHLKNRFTQQHGSTWKQHWKK